MAAEQGNGDAELSLGNMYEMGLGVGKSYAEARKWYGRAALHDDSNGIFAREHLKDLP